MVIGDNHVKYFEMSIAIICDNEKLTQEGFKSTTIGNAMGLGPRHCCLKESLIIDHTQWATFLSGEKMLKFLTTPFFSTFWRLVPPLTGIYWLGGSVLYQPSYQGRWFSIDQPEPYQFHKFLNILICLPSHCFIDPVFILCTNCHFPLISSQGNATKPSISVGSSEVRLWKCSF